MKIETEYSKYEIVFQYALRIFAHEKVILKKSHEKNMFYTTYKLEITPSWEI